MKFLRTTFYRTPPHDCFWIENKYDNTKMKRINKKHNHISYLIHPISSSLASKCCSSLLLKTTVRSSRSQMFLNFLQYSQESTCDGTALWNRGSGVFLWILRNFYEKLFFRAPWVAASGHLHYYLILLFSTFSIFPLLIFLFVCLPIAIE